VVTTTPRAIPLLKRIMQDDATAINRSRTRDNAHALAPAFLAEMQRRYGDTPIGRQELDGEIVEERMTGLWKRAWLDQGRLLARPELVRIVVAVDPPVSSTAGSDSCGIIVAGKGVDNRRPHHPGPRSRHLGQGRGCRLSRLPDRQHRRGDQPGRRSGRADVQEHRRRRAGQEGARQPRQVHRAEPVSALYNEGRVAHVGEFPELERQMCDFAADGLANGKSPDRLDALVWALTELLLTNQRVTPLAPSSACSRVLFAVMVASRPPGAAIYAGDDIQCRRPA
jgi:phage terminase large subunit-like protein